MLSILNATKNSLTVHRLELIFWERNQKYAQIKKSKMSDESEDCSGIKTIIYYISNLLGHQAELDSKHKFIEMLNMRRNVMNSTIHRHIMD